MWIRAVYVVGAGEKGPVGWSGGHALLSCALLSRRRLLVLCVRGAVCVATKASLCSVGTWDSPS